MIKFISYVAMLAIGFTAGVFSVPFPTIILGSNSILKNAQIYDVSTVVLDAENVTIDSNKFYFTKRWFKADQSVYVTNSSNIAITNNVMDNPGPLWDTIKYKFIARPEYYQCIINDIKYKSCDDVPKEIQ